MDAMTTDAKRLRAHAAWLRDGDLGGGAQAERDAQLCERAAAVLERCEVLRRGLEAVNDLIDESRGVTGLHQNGDEAPWSDLLAGGRYEGWLVDLSTALAALGVEP